MTKRPQLRCVMPSYVTLERLGVFTGDGEDLHETAALETLIRVGLMYSWPTVGRPFRVIVGLTRAYETRRVTKKAWQTAGKSMTFETVDSRYEVTLDDQQEH